MRSLLVLTALAALAAAQDEPKPAPVQPLPFSHLQHAGGAKLACKMCHPNPDPGETMRIARAQVCMQCHVTVRAESPAIRKLAEFATSPREIPWVRVYEIPSSINFSHRVHLAAGNRCEECHGPVATRAQLARETNLGMAGCVGCHREKKAPVDCTYCHED